MISRDKELEINPASKLNGSLKLNIGELVNPGSVVVGAAVVVVIIVVGVVVVVVVAGVVVVVVVGLVFE